MARVVGHHADRAALHTSECRHHPQPEVAPQLQHAARVEQAADDGMHVVRPLAVLRDHMAQLALVGALPRLGRALEVAEVLLGDGDRLCLILHHDVHHAVGPLYVDRPDDRRLEHAQATALDHRRAAHPDVAVLRGDDHVAAAEDCRVAGEAVAGVHTDHRHAAGELGPVHERQAVQPADADHVRVARPAPAALGEEHDGRVHLLGQLEQAVLLAVVLPALGAGEHGVVVGHGDHRLAVHRAEAADHPVARGAGDEVLQAAAAALRGDDHRPVLHERAVVHQVVHVLAGGAAADLAPPGDGIGAGGVQPDLVAGHHLRQVVTDVGRVLHRRGHHFGHLHHTGLQAGHPRAFHHGVPRLHQQFGNSAVRRRVDGVVHLHRLDQHQLLTGTHLLTGGDVDGDDGALHGRGHGDEMIPHARRPYPLPPCKLALRCGTTAPQRQLGIVGAG